MLDQAISYLDFSQSGRIFSRYWHISPLEHIPLCTSSPFIHFSMCTLNIICAYLSWSLISIFSLRTFCKHTTFYMRSMIAVEKINTFTTIICCDAHDTILPYKQKNISTTNEYTKMMVVTWLTKITLRAWLQPVYGCTGLHEFLALLGKNYHTYKAKMCRGPFNKGAYTDREMCRGKNFIKGKWSGGETVGNVLYLFGSMAY